MKRIISIEDIPFLSLQIQLLLKMSKHKIENGYNLRRIIQLAETFREATVSGNDQDFGQVHGILTWNVFL